MTEPFFTLYQIDSLSDGLCAGTKIISDKASANTVYNGDFSAISVKEQGCAALISKVESHTLDLGFCAILLVKSEQVFGP